ncbi:diguanylate cyclase [Rheinheimera baltica]|uniref:Diguanylate cyclase n=1 Tax=Rheinheimera baltica TaxID=67576 RepID=A0ABT9HXS4_9GAMM|nr:ligand-binding sensor domain-containing diguanylate cyclase [Rheinheimera baltica]MDP5135768.1 diguanylate cyclase [Rheinheimera baltica]
MRIALVLLLCSLPFCSALADTVQLAASELHLRRLTVRDGLPSAYINRILQRHDGFIWIATKGGLSRFDGKNFSNYQIETDNGLISNDVMSLLEDQLQQLWVGTVRGLFLFDENQQQFKHVPLMAVAPAVLYLFQDPTLGLWVGTDQGLFRLAEDGSVVQHYASDLEVKVVLSYAGKLWLGTKQGLFVVDPVTGDTTAVVLEGGADVDVRQQRIFDALVIGDRFYLATDGDGLLSFDPATGQVVRQWLKTDGLKSNSIWSLATQGETLWIGYFYNGISGLSLKYEKIEHYQHHAQIQYSLPHDNISQLYMDNLQQLWIATTNGLAIANLSDQAIRHIGEYQQISNKHIWSLALDANNLWFGSENGLNLYDLQQHKLTVYNSGDAPGQLPRTVIWGMHVLADEILLATNLGLLVFSPDTAQVRSWPSPPWHKTGRASALYSLRQHQQQLLMGYYGGYFAVYDLASQQYLLHSQIDHADYITDMLPLAKGYLIATDNGLFQLDDGKLTALAEQLPELAAQPLHITSLLQVDKQIWASTQDHGLLVLKQYQTQWQLIKQLTDRDGLPENQLRALAMSPDGRVWLTGMKTLSEINPANLHVRRLSRHLHWLDMEFHANASLKQISNLQAFGGNQGLIFFQQDALVDNAAFPPLHLTAAQLMTEQIVVNNNQLTIPPEASYYAFQFAALDYFSPERIRYQYQLQPLMNDWQPMLSNQLSLSGLSYDDYVLKVRSTNADGLWSEQSTDIQLTLTAPWYLTRVAKWLYALGIMSLLMLALWSLLWRLSALKRVANHDALTHLPNRRYFKHELQRRLQQSRSSQHQLALMFFDLNHFKQLNDSCGHEAGDQLLIQVAGRLTHAIRETDFAARLAGDEFVVILSHIKHQPELDTTVKRISESLCQEYQLAPETRLKLSCSIGISIFNNGNQVNADTLLSQADQAMYISKQQQQPWCYYQLDE